MQPNQNTKTRSKITTQQSIMRQIKLQHKYKEKLIKSTAVQEQVSIDQNTTK